ncbi:MAG: hypothetical protein LC541_14325 [Candidatus Thiodiazotropha sp.]|nr:hypothetical protein [Candidatus Thiodiazotropha sp.]MCM8920765.1 hypothetical protein [Candidatus Thiodiazotropha sp.]
MPANTRSDSRTMSITHAEFLRSLKPLKHYYQVVVGDTGNQVEISDQKLSVVLQLGSEEAVKLGSLTMPSTQVEFTSRYTDDHEMVLFWSRFDLCFRRGGG